MQHVDSGVCFKCEGTGVTPKTIKTNINDNIVLVNPTTKVKTIEKQMTRQQAENEAVRKALKAHQEERKVKWQEWKDRVEERSKK